MGACCSDDAAQGVDAAAAHAASASFTGDESFLQDNLIDDNDDDAAFNGDDDVAFAVVAARDARRPRTRGRDAGGGDEGGDDEVGEGDPHDSATDDDNDRRPTPTPEVLDIEAAERAAVEMAAEDARRRRLLLKGLGLYAGAGSRGRSQRGRGSRISSSGGS